MTDLYREIDGAIHWLHCDACGSVFPKFVFSGEQDSDTAGLVSAAICNQNSVVVIAETDCVEWKDFACGIVASLESRLGGLYSFNDLKIIRLLRVEHEWAVPSPSFSDFRKSYKPAVLIYSCVCCDTGESRVVEEVTVKEFIDSGGRILLAGRLNLRGEERQRPFACEERGQD